MSLLSPCLPDITVNVEKQNKKTTVLIVEHSPVDGRILKKNIEQLGYDAHLAVNGEDGLGLFRKHSPEIVFIDLSLSDMCAQELSFRFKEIKDEAFIPVIFVTEEIKLHRHQKYLNHYGDDFIIKPVQARLLRARMESLLRIKNMHDKVLEEKRAVTTYYQDRTKDIYDADKIIYNMQKSYFYNPGNMQWAFLAKKIISGDMFCSAMAPTGNHIIMIADNTGHGMPAAIGSILTYEVFYSMVYKGYEISDIIEVINNKLGKLLPVDRFLAACFIDIDANYNVMQIWNAGMPDVLVTGSDGCLKQRLNSIYIPLGIEQINKVDIVPVRVNLNDGDLIYCYTDGVVECADENGELFGEKRLLDSISGDLDAKKKFRKLQTDINRFRGYRELSDDIALLQIDCDSSIERRKKQTGEHGEQLKPANWRFKMELDADTIRRTNPVPVILQSISEIQGLKKHHPTLILILTEMYSNALEHGLLKLDSAIKSEENGFSKYYEKRQTLLDKLKDAEIIIDVEHVNDAEKGVLQITVSHNGEGFDHKTVKTALSNNKGQSGRGLALLSTICKSLEYYKQGQEARIEYEWDYTGLMKKEMSHEV